MNAPIRNPRAHTRATAAMLVAAEPKAESPVDRARRLIDLHRAELLTAMVEVRGKPFSTCIVNDITFKQERLRGYDKILRESPASASFICGMLKTYGPGIADVCRRARNFDANQAAFEAARKRISG